MSTTTLAPPRAARRRQHHAFVAMLAARHPRACASSSVRSSIRTIMQPLLTTFVFAYVFPKIGQGDRRQRRVGRPVLDAARRPALISFALIFQGIQAVALPLVKDFGYTREIDDRVLAPMPVWAVGMQKIASGAIQAAFAARDHVPDRAARAEHDRAPRRALARARHDAPARVRARAAPSVSRSARASSPARCR